MWELIFMLVILKIPVVYLCWVVWWAIKAEPRPFEGAAKLAPAPLTQPPFPRLRFSRPRRRGPHGGPVRGYPRTARSAFARAQVDR